MAIHESGGTVPVVCRVIHLASGYIKSNQIKYIYSEEALSTSVVIGYYGLVLYIYRVIHGIEYWSGGVLSE